jgi:uncharacterized protein YjbI with pentapeptide repeats
VSGLAVVGESKLDGADFRQAKGKGPNFRALSITHGLFTDADMPEAVFADGNLAGTSLRCANLPASDFSDARLEDVDCRNANFFQSTLDRARLIKCNLTDASLYGASLLDMEGEENVYTGVNFKMTSLE